MLQQYTISRDSQCWVHRHKLICSKDAEETCHCVHSKNWHTCHKLDNLLLVQTLELSNNLQEPLCLTPLSSSPTIAFHIVYQYLDLPTPHSTVAQQEFHSCGVSQGSCSAERAIPNLQKICTVGKICIVGAIQWCFNWQDPKTLSKTSKLQDESCFNSLRKPLFN